MLGALSRFLAARVTPGMPASGDIPWISGGMATAAAQDVSAESALKSTTWLAGVQRISFTIARLPLVLHKRTADDGRERARNHPLYSILHDQPNPEQCAFSWKTRMTASLLSYGNAYSWIQRNDYGQVIGLWQLKSPSVTAVRENGALHYEVISDGKTWKLLPGEIFHLSGWALWGLLGIAQVELGREAIGLDLATGDFRARYTANDQRPGMVVKKKGITAGGKEKLANFLEYWKMSYGGKNRGLPAVIDAEDDVKEISSNPQQSQMAEGLTFQVQELCRVLGLPPHHVSELSRAHFANIEHQGIDALNYSFGPWMTLWEQETNRQLLNVIERKRYFAEFIVDSLLKADIGSRYKAFSVGWNRWLTTNEIRAKENMPPVDGGDEMGDPMGSPTGASGDSAGNSDGNDGGDGNGSGQKQNAMALSRWGAKDFQ